MQKLIGIQALATPFSAHAQLMAEDVRPELDRLWNSGLKEMFKGRTVQQDGFRPRPIQQTDLEVNSQDLTKLYYTFWFGSLVDGIRAKTGKRVAYLDDLNVVKQGNAYIVTAIVFPQPEVTWLPDKDQFMKGLAEIFLSDKPVDEHHVEEEIINRKLKLRFDRSRMKVDKEYQEALVMEDVVLVEITNEFAKAQGRPPEQHVIRLSHECPEEYLTPVMGARVGDNVLASKALDPEGKQRVTLMVKIIGKVDAPDVTDDELCKSGGYANADAMRMNVRREIERNISTKMPELFATYVRTRTRLSPIPGAMVFDRAEGYVNHLVQTKSPAELRRAGIIDPNVATQAMLPRFNEGIYREVVCAEIAAELGLSATDEDFKEWFVTNSIEDTAEVRYVAEMDILMRRVTTYYQTKGQDRGDVKRIVGATSVGTLPPPGDQPSPSNNLIYFK